MSDKAIVLTTLVIVALALSTVATSALAFIYPDGSQDGYFENFGPRMDQILVKKYASLQSEVDALKAGEIDFTDSTLERAMIDDLSTDPNIAIVNRSGSEYSNYYTLNFNNNPNEYLGNPPNPLYPNPVYTTNPCVVTEFRQACSHLIDRNLLCTGPGQGMYEPIFTPIPAYMTYWIHPNISYTGSLSVLTYPPSVADAATKLDAGGFHLGGAGGKRYWDRNDNNVYDAGEDFTIEAYTRLDILRKGAADMLCNGFDDPLLQVPYSRHPCTGGQAWQTCMVEKNYHLYTAGWTYIGPDPDYFYDLYHWDNYYHPEDPPNFGAISQYDADMQTALEGIEFTPDSAMARNYAYTFQELFAESACEVPLGSTSSPKAYNKWYTGGNDGAALGDAEDKYRGQLWKQVVNMKGQGPDNYYTFLNAYPEPFQYGDGNMIARYGWKDNTMPQTLNPMYSSWFWEWQVLNEIYDRSGQRDPMTQGPVEVLGLAENWSLGTWTHPVTTEELTKVALKIRSNVEWSDGAPLTVDDVIYSLITLPEDLASRICPDVWWNPTLEHIVSFFRLDAYTVEILLDVNTYLGANWIASAMVVPKHIWHPFITNPAISIYEIMGDMSNRPEMLVGSGPFEYVQNTAETLLMTRNPTYTGLFDEAVQYYNQYGPLGTQNKEGITVAAVTPTTQITPFKVNPAGTPPTADVHVTVPVTNLDVNDAQDFDKTIVVTGPSGVVYTYGPVNIFLGATAWDIGEFDLTDLPPGIYTITATIEIKSGDVYDWVTANLDPALWPMILGPYTTEKNFWVTVLADLNEDRVVDIFDIVIVGSRFGAELDSFYYDYLYSPQADINHDFIIDIFDIVQVALVFGWPG